MGASRPPPPHCCPGWQEHRMSTTYYYIYVAHKLQTILTEMREAFNWQREGINEFFLRPSCVRYLGHTVRLPLHLSLPLSITLPPLLRSKLGRIFWCQTSSSSSCLSPPFKGRRGPRAALHSISPLISSPMFLLIQLCTEQWKWLVATGQSIIIPKWATRNLNKQQLPKVVFCP